MGCKNCKDKELLKKEILNTDGKTPKKIIWFTVIWSILSIYGLISLFDDLIKWVHIN